MENLENLITTMKNEGINVEQITVVKNGVQCKGIRIIESGKINPIIYYSSDETINELAQRIRDAATFDRSYVDFKVQTAPEYVKEHITLGIQRHGYIDALSKRYLNLDLYMLVEVSAKSCDKASVKVTKFFAETVGLDESELWKAAFLNSGRFEIHNVSEVLGLPAENGPDLYVVTSSVCEYGAAALAFPGVFERFCKDKDIESVYILPSSTNELLLYKDIQGWEAKALAKMVADVNASQVEEVLQLDPVCYRYRRGSGNIEIAATASEGR